MCSACVRWVSTSFSYLGLCNFDNRRAVEVWDQLAPTPASNSWIAMKLIPVLHRLTVACRGSTKQGEALKFAARALSLSDLSPSECEGLTPSERSQRRTALAESLYNHGLVLQDKGNFADAHERWVALFWLVAVRLPTRTHMFEQH